EVTKRGRPSAASSRRRKKSRFTKAVGGADSTIETARPRFQRKRAAHHSSSHARLRNPPAGSRAGGNVANDHGRTSKNEFNGLPKSRTVNRVNPAACVIRRATGSGNPSVPSPAPPFSHVLHARQCRTDSE